MSSLEKLGVFKIETNFEKTHLVRELLTSRGPGQFGLKY